MTGAERLTYGKMPSWVVSPVGFLVWGHARTVRINRAEGDTLDAQGRLIRTVRRRERGVPDPAPTSPFESGIRTWG